MVRAFLALGLDGTAPAVGGPADGPRGGCGCGCCGCGGTPPYMPCCPGTPGLAGRIPVPGTCLPPCCEICCWAICWAMGEGAILPPGTGGGVPVERVRLLLPGLPGRALGGRHALVGDEAGLLHGRHANAQRQGWRGAHSNGLARTHGGGATSAPAASPPARAAWPRGGESGDRGGGPSGDGGCGREGGRARSRTWPLRGAYQRRPAGGLSLRRRRRQHSHGLLHGLRRAPGRRTGRRRSAHRRFGGLRLRALLRGRCLRGPHRFLGLRLFR